MKWGFENLSLNSRSIAATVARFKLKPSSQEPILLLHLTPSSCSAVIWHSVRTWIWEFCSPGGEAQLHDFINLVTRKLTF